MATETPSVAPSRAEVPMVDAEVVRQIRELHRGGWGAKRIARELEVARNTVRRYLRLRTVEAGIQMARRLVRPRRDRRRDAARQVALPSPWGGEYRWSFRERLADERRREGWMRSSRSRRALALLMLLAPFVCSSSGRSS